ncbi:hypothetical protein [Wukongibacter sp. M2B1]
MKGAVYFDVAGTFRRCGGVEIQTLEKNIIMIKTSRCVLISLRFFR